MSSLNIQITSGGAAAPVSILTPEPIHGARALLERGGYNPDKTVIDGPVTTTVNDKNGETRYRFKALEEVNHIDELYRIISGRRPRAPFKIANRTVDGFGIEYADPQHGKTGSRGGTPELLERSARIRHDIVEHARKRKPAEIGFFDLGDGIESFNNTGSQAFTNDQSLPQQILTYALEIFEWVDQLARIAPVKVGIVPSNHSAWREGKQQLGRPEDDFGIMVHKLAQDMAKRQGLRAEWFFPEPEEESVTVELVGRKVGLVHGNQFAPGGAVKWWQNQTFGKCAVSDAELLLSGHYHTEGRSRVTAEKWWLGAPTLDNGSDWFRNKTGLDTLPGMVTFEMGRDRGFDYNSQMLWE